MNNLIQEIENIIQITVGNLCKNIAEKYDLDSKELMKIWNTQNNNPQVNKTSKTNTKKTEKNKILNDKNFRAAEKAFEAQDKYFLQQENKRRILLRKKLKEYDLDLRSDSRLCQKYIENEYIPAMNIDEVVQRMCQMRFLFDYCNMRQVLEKVGQEQYEELDAGYIPDVPVFEWAEFLILEEIKSYPTEWPWIVTIINKNKSKFNLCLDELKLLPPKHQFIGGEDYIDALHRFTQFQMD